MEVNGQVVEGESHSRVIELIKSNPNKLRMVLMSVPAKENERLDGETNSYCSEDEYEATKVDITIPNISQKEENASGKTVVYYNVYLDGKFLCSHRYKAFYDLQVDLKNKFYQYEFPKFPGKWPFQLSQSQLEKRHKELEQWLINICSVSTLYSHFYIQDFFGLVNNNKTQSKDSESIDSKNEPDNADIKVFLPGGSAISVNIPTESYVKQLLETVCDKVDIPYEFSSNFTIYKSYDPADFLVPVSRSEKPFQLHVKNYSESKKLHFYLKKLVFCPEKELEICGDEACLNTHYQEAVEDLTNNKYETVGKEIELKRTQHATTQKDFLKVVQTCPGYNTVTFPHCPCDSRKEGHVILIITFNKIAIQACSTSGEKESQVKNFSWQHVSDFGSNEDDDVFHFTITKNNADRKISFKSPYSDYMQQVFDCISNEKSSL